MFPIVLFILQIQSNSIRIFFPNLEKVSQFFSNFRIKRSKILTFFKFQIKHRNIFRILDQTMYRTSCISRFSNGLIEFFPIFELNYGTNSIFPEFQIKHPKNLRNFASDTQKCFEFYFFLCEFRIEFDTTFFPNFKKMSQIQFQFSYKTIENIKFFQISDQTSKHFHNFGSDDILYEFKIKHRKFCEFSSKHTQMFRFFLLHIPIEFDNKL